MYNEFSISAKSPKSLYMMDLHGSLACMNLYDLSSPKPVQNQKKRTMCQKLALMSRKQTGKLLPPNPKQELSLDENFTHSIIDQTVYLPTLTLRVYVLFYPTKSVFPHNVELLLLICYKEIHRQGKQRNPASTAHKN